MIEMKNIFKKLNEFIDNIECEELSVSVSGAYSYDGHFLCNKCNLCIECGDCKCPPPKKYKITLEIKE